MSDLPFNFGIKIVVSFATALAFLFQFGIVRGGDASKTFCRRKSFSIIICGDDMALMHDSNTKWLLHVSDNYVRIKILQHLVNFTTCLRHV